MTLTPSGDRIGDRAQHFQQVRTDGQPGTREAPPASTAPWSARGSVAARFSSAARPMSGQVELMRAKSPPGLSPHCGAGWAMVVDAIPRPALSAQTPWRAAASSPTIANATVFGSSASPLMNPW
jgi:hypothetical protein